MKQLTLIIITMFCFGIAIASAHKHKKKPTKAAAIKTVAVRHTACYGKCRVFTVSVDADGLATYDATMFNADTGTFLKQIGKAEASEIFKEFADARLDTCPDLYPNRIADLPGVIITVTYPEKVKTIRNANYGPAGVQHLIKTLDALVGEKVDAGWKKKKKEH